MKNLLKYNRNGESYTEITLILNYRKGENSGRKGFNEKKK